MHKRSARGGAVALAAATRWRAGRAATTCTRAGRPSGEAAPADGWSGVVRRRRVRRLRRRHLPAAGRRAGRGAGRQATRTANTDRATWAFEAPAGETHRRRDAVARGGRRRRGGGQRRPISSGSLARPKPASSTNAVAASGMSRRRATPAQPLSAENRVVVPAGNLGLASLRRAPPAAGVAGVRMPGRRTATPTATRPPSTSTRRTSCSNRAAGPTASNVSGELASAPTVSGTSDVTFSASDPGLGGVRGGVQRRRPGGAEHGARRKRRALQERGADERRAGGVPVRAARARRR